MINESLFSKYFQEEYKRKPSVQDNHYGFVLIGATPDPDRVLISSPIMITRVPAKTLLLKPFSDRSLFPEFPQSVGDSYLYSKTRGFQKTGPRLNEYLQDQLTTKLQELTVSRWQYAGHRLLYAQDEACFIPPACLEVFTSEFKAFRTPGPRTNNVILAHHQPTSPEDILAVIAPTLINSLERLPDNLFELLGTKG